MDEKQKNIEIKKEFQKLEWEAPKLISLDKRGTEGGEATPYTESIYGAGHS